MELKKLALKRKDLLSVPPETLQIKEGWNSRDAEHPDNREHIETLARSIEAIGVQQPLTVYSENGIHYVLDGHCRLAAVKLAISRGAEIASVPVQIEVRGSDEGDRLVGQMVRNSGKRLEPLEAANVVKQLLDLGWPDEKIATRIGMSKAYIASLLDLRAAPIEVKEMVRKGEVSATLANSTLKAAKGDSGAATAKLKGAVDSAKASGKAKATAKDLGMSAGAKLALLTQIIKNAAVTDSYAGDAGRSDLVVHLTVNAADWDRVKEALNIKE